MVLTRVGGGGWNYDMVGGGGGRGGGGKSEVERLREELELVKRQLEQSRENEAHQQLLMDGLDQIFSRYGSHGAIE
jgi:hypothetical protein